MAKHPAAIQVNMLVVSVKRRLSEITEDNPRSDPTPEEVATIQEEPKQLDLAAASILSDNAPSP